MRKKVVMLPEISFAMAAIKSKYLFAPENMDTLIQKYGKAQSVKELPDWIQKAYRAFIR